MEKYKDRRSLNSSSWRPRGSIYRLKDGLTHFGFKYLEALFKLKGLQQDFIEDLIAIASLEGSMEREAIRSVVEAVESAIRDC
jgi:hypothetical protein